MFIVTYRKIFYIFSALLSVLAIYGMFAYGFNFGVDFHGGTITEVRYLDERPDKSVVEKDITSLGLGAFSVRPSESDRYIVRTRELNNDERSALVEVMSQGASDKILLERQNTVGPVAGAELKSKALKAVVVVITMIVLFITFAFRKVSIPVSSWKYGFATILALVHDTIVPVGVFVFLGKFYGIEIDLLFVGGLLAILGYSVHDTIVVFDRVRENLKVNEESRVDEKFEVVVGKSITQTLGRSINTSVTLVIVLIALYFIGSVATREFTLLLTLGVIAGTYSSIFLASPFLVTFYKLQKNKGLTGQTV